MLAATITQKGDSSLPMWSPMLSASRPRCEAVTFWGVSDAHTWISGDTPLLFAAQYAAKPAHAGVLDALRGR